MSNAQSAMFMLSSHHFHVLTPSSADIERKSTELITFDLIRDRGTHRQSCPTDPMSNFEVPTCHTKSMDKWWINPFGRVDHRFGNVYKYERVTIFMSNGDDKTIDPFLALQKA